MRCTLLFVSTTFAQALEAALVARGLNAYKLQRDHGFDRANTSRWLAGKEVPRDTTIDEIAKALDADAEELHALADVHRLGPTRAAGILKYGPIALGAQAATEAPAPTYAGPPKLKVVGELPKPHAYDAYTGGAPLLSKYEIKAVEQLLAITGGDLAKYKLGPEAAVWTYEGEDRLKGLNTRITQLGGQPVAKKARKA